MGKQGISPESESQKHLVATTGAGPRVLKRGGDGGKEQGVPGENRGFDASGAEKEEPRNSW